MDPIEKAIRSAFDKGNAEDPAFRSRIYESAYAALDRALKSRPEMTVEAAIQRRRGLQARIAEIETEFTSAEEDEVVPDLYAEAEAAGNETLFPTLDDDRAGTVPQVAPGDRRADELGAMPDLERLPDGMYAPVAAEVSPDAEPRRRPRRRRRLYAIGFVVATLLAAAGIGIWWTIQTGLLLTAQQRDTAVPNPPQTVTDEDFSPDDAGTPGVPPPLHSETTERNWISVFTPADPTLASAPQGASAEVMQDESGTFLRVRSGDSGAAVLFDVGQGILEQAAGKKAVFDIVARAEEGKETEVTVDCNFGELGDCGRKRYLVGYEQGEYLFEVNLPERDPGAGGTIAINSDFSNQGKSVDIYEIRMSVSE
ncbi:MAG: hypothetical protein JNL61_06150 [Rhizobiaceae bacterium]|nr:hypothetical protein [Rhizobiaceae bacterium]